MLWWNKKNEKGKVRKGKRKKISDVHTSPVVAADAVRPDGCTLANDGETHGDAPLRAQIINIAHTIFLIINYITAVYTPSSSSYVKYLQAVGSLSKEKDVCGTQ